VASRKSSTKKPRPKKPAADAEEAKSAEQGDEEEAEASDEDDGEREPNDDDVEPVDADSDVEVVDDSELEKVAAPKAASRGAITRADPLALYMSEVQRHKLLTSEEEHSLAVDYSKTGNVDAAARLVTSNLRLVVKIAYEYRRAYRNIMDLIQEGNIGLMQAVKRYDPYRGVKLSSYAAWWIRAYMLRFILNNWRLVKIGTTQAQRRLFFNLNKEKARLTAMGIEPSHSTIATNLRVDEKDVVEMDRRLARGDASLDAPVGDAEGRQTTRMELLASTTTDPEASVESTELSELVRDRLAEFRKTLTGKELQIFDDRLIAEDPLTLQELGDRFGVSRERVRQLEARLTGKLRTFLKSELGDAVEVGT
jgi:RNA polymerase sigma-32 factor